MKGGYKPTYLCKTKQTIESTPEVKNPLIEQGEVLKEAEVAYNSIIKSSKKSSNRRPQNKLLTSLRPNTMMD